MLDTPAPPAARARLAAVADVPHPFQRPPAGGWRAAIRRLWRWRLRAATLLVALAALWYGAIPLILGPVVPATSALRAEFLQSVVASGHVEAPYRINIGSQITGIVAEVPVAEGQAVKAGDTLVVLDDREARTAVIQAESAVAQADARLRQMRELTLPSAEEALRQAKATLINAQQGHDRAAKLAESGYGTRATLDDAVKALDIARAQVRHAELQVFTSRPGGSDYVMAETQLDQARAGLATVQSRLAYTRIVAPRDGLLIARDVERGNVVQPTNVLMKLSPIGDTQLVVQIDEKNLGLVAVGQSALASADAFPAETFAAEVVFINPGIDLQRASVEVKLRVRDPPAYLRQDMTVSVDVEVARHPGALIVPAASVRGLAGGKPWVMMVEDGRAARRPVQLGIVSAGKAEILGGLADGDLVLAANAAVQEGARIRPLPQPLAAP